MGTRKNRVKVEVHLTKADSKVLAKLARSSGVSASRLATRLVEFGVSRGRAGGVSLTGCLIPAKERFTVASEWQIEMEDTVSPAGSFFELHLREKGHRWGRSLRSA